MKFKTTLIGIFLVVMLLNFISASGFSGNGYWDKATDQCWRDKNTPPGVPYFNPDSNESVGLFQCCMNYYGIQIDCYDSSEFICIDEYGYIVDCDAGYNPAPGTNVYYHYITEGDPYDKYDYTYNNPSSPYYDFIQSGGSVQTNNFCIPVTGTETEAITNRDFSTLSLCEEQITSSYPDNTEDEETEEVEEIVEVIDDSENEVELNEPQEEVIENVAETISETIETPQIDQVSEIVKSSSKKSSKKSSDKEEPNEEIISQNNQEIETIKNDNEIIILKSEETEKGVLVLFIQFISNLFS